jgi:hypothetical protein
MLDFFPNGGFVSTMSQVTEGFSFRLSTPPSIGQ